MELDSTLGFILGRVSRKVHYRLDDIFKSRHMTIEQWVGLRIIHEDGPLCQKKLADRMEKNQNTTKALVDRLEDKGLIRRTVDPGDRRNLTLTLTDQGLDLLCSLSPLEAEVNALIEGSLTQKQTETLKNLLLKLEKKL
ncbi:MarR family transcriptional regulator [Mesosutterella sp. OilRF-GAM-744-9]|uniref:MarR family transcriptional regulator n=1 Tax=Mesosutterella porci TaxID=2915351 RepID=A0ABS9MMX2_9BURK|nr:MarR family transcriptional regulator [Mesosutterella sp. oilRF-744-WT-GAM-9]MCG5029964.1 MarR family transcriptional regulator [Mesosutterella sp. oilRF-744-WT-GAM-9]